MKRKPLYNYAINKEGRIVHIDNAVKDKSVSYYCLGCRTPMHPKQGENNQWHFAHKSNSSKSKNPNCSPESYLHMLAKESIFNFFCESKVFYITLQVKGICSNSLCPIGLKNGCEWKKSVRINLKDSYNKCTLEKEINGFRADLLLTNQSEERPILIEIYHTHKCSEEKIKSKLPIIEIYVKKEEDIENLISLLSMKEDVGDKNVYNNSVKFYNFVYQTEEPEIEFQKDIYLFYLDSNKLFNFNENMPIKCLDWLMLKRENCKFLMASSKLISRELAIKTVIESGITLCTLCLSHSSINSNNHCSIYDRISANKKGCSKYIPIKYNKNNYNQEFRIIIP